MAQVKVRKVKLLTRDKRKKRSDEELTSNFVGLLLIALVIVSIINIVIVWHTLFTEYGFPFNPKGVIEPKKRIEPKDKTEYRVELLGDRFIINLNDNTA